MSDTLIRAIWPIEDQGPLVRCAPDVDLDALLLEVLTHVVGDDDYGGAWMQDDDEPSGIPSYYGPSHEARVGWWRIDPCGANCGEHGWHLRRLGEEKPTGKIARGAFFGVSFE